MKIFNRIFQVGRIWFWLTNYDFARQARCIDIGIAFAPFSLSEGEIAPHLRFYKFLISKLDYVLSQE